MELVNKIFTVVVITFPILSLYGIGLGTFTFGDLLLCVLTMLATINGLTIRAIKISHAFLLFALYILFNFIFINAFHGLNSGVALRTFRYLFYIIVLALFIPKYFLPSFGRRIFFIVSLLSIAMMVLQTGAFLFLGKYIPGYIPGVPIIRDELVAFSEASKVDSLGLLRPRSFFGEPAHYCQFLLGFLCLYLFDKRQSQYKLCILILLICGIVISMSSTGIICMCFLLLVYFKSHWKKLIIYAPVLCLSLLILYNTDYIQGFITRMQDGKSASDRFAGYSVMIDSLNNMRSFFLGNGMLQLEGDYLSGYMRLFYYFGIIGVIIFLYAMFSRYSKIDDACKVLVWLFVVLNIGTEVALGPFILVYLSFILTNNANRNNNLKLQRLYNNNPTIR